jgi:hypothetical protein
MFASNRRVERRDDIIETIKEQGFEVAEIDDWSFPETQGHFLEGTGSMIFDHDNKIAYGSVSLRLDENLFREFCEVRFYAGCFPFIPNRWRRKTSDLPHQCDDVCSR